MSIAQANERLQIPESLHRQLADFRRRVWTIKTIEAVCAAAFGVLAMFLVLFTLDRVGDTPSGPRVGLLGLAALACLIVPLALYRWVWRQRRPDQLARLLARKHPRIGDQLLGVIELAHDDSEQSRSRRLVEAAIEQVALDSAKRNFRDAVPTPRHRRWIGALVVPALVVAALVAICPDAASNAWSRLVAPWKATPRYTFAALEPIPSRLVVAHGEPFHFGVKLAGTTVWHPVKAEVRIGGRPPVVASLKDGRYEFDLPAQVATTPLEVRVGDATQLVEVEPMLRPELNAITARVTLPEYLGRPGSQVKDAKGGTITLVKGSQAEFTATVGRDLAAAWINDVAVTPRGATITSAPVAVDGAQDLQLRWVDRFGLAGKDPFTLKVVGRDDEAPSLSVENLPRQKVILDSELLNFKVRAQDDFGVRRVGLEWEGIDRRIGASVATGDRVLAGGGPDKEAIEVAGAFSAKSFGIEPQPIALRVFVEDYLPGRPRVVSSPFILFILTPEQHAIWLTEQLSRWHRQALEVRDREMSLYENNKQLRSIPPADLDKPENRKKLESQAAAEQANGRRLSNLTMAGDDLVKQAMRNPEFGVGHLERWAEMLQILKDISANRMPSVASLLKQAAQAPKGAPPAPAVSNNAPMAGNVRSNAQPKPSDPPPPGAPKPPSAVPTIADQESTQQPPDTKETKPSPGSAPKTPRLLLPVTTLTGGVKPGDPAEPPPAAAKVDEALTQQRDLLAEFDKVADELNKILANLEGSTLVKRLKAASRLQTTVAGKIGNQVDKAFGVPQPNPAGPVVNTKKVARDQMIQALAAGDGKPKEAIAAIAGIKLEPPAPVNPLEALAADEAKSSLGVSIIMDDLAAYFERRRYVRFKVVLDEMKEKDVIGALRQLGDDVTREQGMSIAQCEYWSDSLDRWAEDLVDPAKSGACPGSKSRASLPPSVVLEVLQILEGEVNLREETRVAEQARPALAAPDFAKQAGALAKTQGNLQERVVKVIDRIKDLPDSESEFPKEIALLEQVAVVMAEATEILASPDTGSPAIAAETDAIELLLQSKRINPKGGGGGGSSPGGGGTGTTQDSALALVGRGTNKDEVREDRGTSQATGESGPALPEEFRAGLDQYFNKLERGSAGQ